MRNSRGPSVCTSRRRGTDVSIPQSIDGRIRFAITHKRLIKVSYNGVLRTAEPHDYGLVNGIERLFIYQVRGGTATAGKPPWRLLDVAKIESLEVLDERFAGSRHASGQRHHAWDAVYARVA
jgi:hypothetical protein